MTSFHVWHEPPAWQAETIMFLSETPWNGNYHIEGSALTCMELFSSANEMGCAVMMRPPALCSTCSGSRCGWLVGVYMAILQSRPASRAARRRIA